MKYGIYIDVFVITNFFMDYLALFLANIFLGRKQSFWKLLLPSFLGAIGSLVLFLTLSGSVLYVILVHFILNPMMVWLTFRERAIRRFLEDWAVTYLVVILMGGSMQWLYETVFHGEKLGLCIAITWLIGAAASVLWEKQLVTGRRTYDVTLHIGAETVNVRAFYDTGNLLTDPYFCQPVSIVSKACITCCLEKHAVKKRLITFSSLGESNGLMEAFTIDKMLIYRGKHVLVIEPAVLGLAEDEMFAHRDYQMILNSQLLKKQE